MKAFYDVFWHGFVKKNTETAKNSTIHFQLMQQNGTGSLFLCNEKKRVFFLVIVEKTRIVFYK